MRTAAADRPKLEGPPSFPRSVDTRDLFRALLDFWRDGIEASVDVVRRPWGVITRAERYPTVFMANEALVASTPEEGVPRILADLDAVYAGSEIRHRRVWFEDAEEAFAAQDAFVEAEFKPSAEVAMARVGMPSCIVNPDVAIREAEAEVVEEDYRGIWSAMDEASGYDAKLSHDLYALGLERSRVLRTRRFVAYLNGEPAGIFLLWPRGRFALIDDVGTHPRFRMKGVGRTMIFEACHRAILERCEWTLLTADLFDTPQMMYKTLGFEPIGELRGFFRA